MLLNYIRILSLKRIVNLAKCRLSFLLSKMGKVRVNHLPVFVSVEPANRCNLHCPECPVGKGLQTAKVAYLDNVDFLDDISGSLMVVQFYFQGEPLLNNKLPDLIKYANSKRLFTIVSTNAQLLDRQWAYRLVESGLDKIIVSIDGYTQDSYAQYRVGGTLDKAKQALKYLNEAKSELNSSIQIVLQCLMLKSNENEWHLLRQHYTEWGATKIEFKTAQFDDYAHGNPLMPSNSKFSRYIHQSDGKYKRKKAYKNYCYRLWSGCVVSASGDVVPCCFCKDLKYVYGNVNEEPIAKIWRSKQADKFRRALLTDRKKIKMCMNCTE